MQLALCYKNFAANANISHIGLGVSALNTANQLSDFDKEHHHNVGDALLAGTTFGQYGKGLDKQREAIQSQIAAAEALASSKATEANAAQAQGTNTKAEESGALSATSIANQTKAATALATLHRTQAEIQIAAAHAVRQAEIDGILESQTRAVASSAEQVRVALETRDALQKIDFDETQAHIAQVNARAAAESRGKSAPEAARIQTTARGEVAGLTATQVQEETKLQGDYIKAEGAYVEAVATLERYLSEEVIKSGEKRMEAINKEVDAILAAAKRGREESAKVGEIQAKGKGETDDLTIAANKLAFERAYGIESLHTAAQNIEYARQLAVFDEQARAAKIAGLQADLVIAQHDYENENHLAKAATIEREINKLKLEGANIDTAAATKRQQDAEKLTLQYQIQAAVLNAAKSVPGALGGSLATGVVNGGRNIGKDVADALKNVGQQLLGTVFKAVIEKLIAELIVHAGLTSLLAAITGTSATTQAAAATAQTTATVANTVALAANTAAQAGSAGVGAAGAGVSAAGGIAGGVAAAAGSAATAGVTQAIGSIIGGLIAAVGAVVGGVISGTISAGATLYGDTKIVAAIHGTTSAVLSLRTAPIATGTGGTGGTSSTDQANLNAGGGGFLGYLSKITGQGALPVSIVSISPLASFNGFLGLLPFASGGSPPVGVPSLIGERGAELFVPREAGVIVPHDQIAGYLAGGGALPTPNASTYSNSTSSSSYSSGSQTFHFNIHAAANTRETLRAIATYLKSSSPTFAPLSK